MAPEPTNEPQSRLHEELKAYAAMRRKAAGEFRLPPDTRQVLRREVDRQFAWRRHGMAVLVGWMRRLPAWGWLATAALALTVGGLVWNRWAQLPRSGESGSVGLAMKSEPLGATPPPVAAPVEGPVVALAPASPVPEPVAALRAAPAKLAMRSAAPKTLTAPSAAAPTASRAASNVANVAPLSQTFVRTVVAGRSAETTVPGTLPVLNRFRLDLSGQQVRVVDADGSVYDGRLVLRPAVGAATATEAERALPTGYAVTAARTTARDRAVDPVATPPTAAGEVHFEVRGTNVTVRRPVQLQGVLTPAGSNSGTTDAPVATPSAIWLQNSAVRGQVRVGNEQPTFLQAQPAIAPAPRR